MTDDTKAALPKGELAERLLEWADKFSIQAYFAGESRAENDAFADDLRAAASLLGGGVPEGWQPIETAPKDGTWFLACGPSGDWRRISWGRNRHGDLCWCSVDYYFLEAERRFTHWMPLPRPPQSGRE